MVVCVQAQSKLSSVSPTTTRLLIKVRAGDVNEAF